MIITIDLKKSYFVHCLLIVQDLFGGNWHSEHTWPAEDTNVYEWL